MACSGLLRGVILVTIGAALVCARDEALAEDIPFPNILQTKVPGLLRPTLDGNPQTPVRFQPVNSGEPSSSQVRKARSARATKAKEILQSAQSSGVPATPALGYASNSERALFAQSPLAQGGPGSEAMAQAPEPGSAAQAEITEAKNKGKNNKKEQSGPQPLEKEVAPQEYNVFRQDAAVLTPGKFEVAGWLGYVKNNGFIQYDRAFQAGASIRAGIMDRVELAVNVPYYEAWRTTQVGFNQYANYKLAHLGDATAQVSVNVLKETADIPAVHITAGGTFPTGASPYVITPNYTAGENPIDPLNGYQSRRQWGIFSNVLLVKTVDPLILFGSVGFDDSLPTNVMDHRIVWPVKFVYNTGVAFAVSEKTSLGFTLIGSYQGNVKVDGVDVPQTASEPIIGRVSVVQRLFDANTYAEPSIAWGLSKDAPNLVLNLTVRRRF